MQTPCNLGPSLQSTLRPIACVDNQQKFTWSLSICICIYLRVRNVYLSVCLSLSLSYRYFDQFQPLIHSWIEDNWSNIRWTNGPGASSGSSGINYEAAGIPSSSWSEGAAWRLTVLVYDANTKSARQYLDGHLLCKFQLQVWSVL